MLSPNAASVSQWILVVITSCVCPRKDEMHGFPVKLGSCNSDEYSWRYNTVNARWANIETVLLLTVSLIDSCIYWWLPSWHCFVNWMVSPMSTGVSICIALSCRFLLVGCFWTVLLLPHCCYFSIVHRSRRLNHVLVCVWTLSFHTISVLVLYK